jgi:hypothetical protein
MRKTKKRAFAPSHEKLATTHKPTKAATRAMPRNTTASRNGLVFYSREWGAVRHIAQQGP